MAEPLADRFDLATLIGRGPHGSVWRARQRDTGECVAVKILDEAVTRDRRVRDRLDREQETLTAFVHPALVRPREFVVDRGITLVTELVNGHDVRGSNTFGTRESLRVAAAAADALAALHARQVVHCGVKPSNVLLVDVSGQVRISDCGLARVLRGHRVGPTRFADARYAAPELILGGDPAPPTDIYQLGLVLYEMLTGTAFVDGADPIDVLSRHLAGASVVLPTSASAVGELLARCVSTDPAVRPTAAQLAWELRSLGRPPLLIEPSGGAPAGAEVSGAEPAGPHDLVFPVAATVEPAAEAGSAAPVEVRRVHSAATTSRRRVPWRRLLAGAAALVVVGSVVSLFAWAVPDTPGGGDAGRGGARSAGPTEVQPVAPSAPAVEPTVDGASAFVRYWFATLNFATVTGDSALLEAASSPDCQTCTAATMSVRAGHRPGRSLRGGQYTVRDVAAGAFTPNRPELSVVFDRTPRSVIDSDGAPVEVSPGATFATCQVVLDLTGRGWSVRAVLCVSPLP